MQGKRAAAVVALTVMIALVALRTNGAAASATPLKYSQSFESGIDSWTPASDHHERAFRISRTTALAYQGAASLEYFLDGRNDDGTIWVQRRFKGLPASTVLSVTVKLQLHSVTKSTTNNWPVVVYAGAAPPALESGFLIVGQTDQTAGWSPYSGRILARTDPLGQLWLAVGLGATWEGTRTYHIDFLEISAK